MLLYCHSTRPAQAKGASQSRRPGAFPSQPNMATMTLASHAQARGFASLSSISTIRRTASLPSTSTSNPSSRSSSPYPNTPSSTVSTPALSPSVPLPSVEQMVNQEAEDAAQDIAAVKGEIYRWKQVPLCSMDKPLDLVQFWGVNSILNYITSIC